MSKCTLLFQSSDAVSLSKAIAVEINIDFEFLT